MDFYHAPTHVNKYHSFEIYQLPLSSKKFMYDTDWEKASKKFEPFDYCCTYKGRFLDEPYIRKIVKKKNNMMTDLDLLEALFYMTALEPPKTLGGHPIKSSFVVVLHRGDDEKETLETSRAYYCNPIGWTNISDIWWQEHSLVLTDAVSAAREKQYVKLSDVQSMLENAGKVFDGEYCGYCTEDVRICDLPVYEFEDPDTQDQKTEEPISLCKYRNEDKCSMYCSGFDITCEDYESVDKVSEEDNHEN